jgi:hypothetical protein
MSTAIFHNVPFFIFVVKGGLPPSKASDRLCYSRESGYLPFQRYGKLRDGKTRRSLAQVKVPVHD